MRTGVSTNPASSRNLNPSLGAEHAVTQRMGSVVALLIASAAAFVVVASTAAGAPSPLDVSDAGALACVLVRTESRYVPYGYNHVVILTNGCGRDATCSVATDVSPAPIVIEVRSGATVEAVTFMASPSSSFVARVACQIRGARS